MKPLTLAAAVRPGSEAESCFGSFAAASLMALSSPVTRGAKAFSSSF